MSSPTLSLRAINRATLARQLLLERAALPVEAAVEHLVGLQAQTTHSWYTGLWTRLRGFEAAPAGALLAGRRLVRIALMRSTIHLVTAADCLALRPLVQPVIERSMRGNYGRDLLGLDREALVAAGRAAVEAKPLTFSALGRALAGRWPDRDPVALAHGVRAWVPLVQVPPRGVWGASGLAAHTSAESWLGRPLAALPLEDLVLRYLGAFGPATVRDAQTWSGLTRLGEVFAGLRPRLRTFRDPDGAELFDLPHAPRPDADAPAPVRFLYDYDNLLLSHADRRRVIAATYFDQDFTADGPMPSILLVDGFTAGSWRLARRREAAILTVQPFTPLPAATRDEVAAEGARLLAFLAPEATQPEVQLVAPRGTAAGDRAPRAPAAKEKA
jgi:hypothetical protein